MTFEELFGSLAPAGRAPSADSFRVRATESDADLVRGFLSGDEEGFAALLDRYLPTVYAFAYRYIGNVDDARDVAQDTFIKVWKHIKRFDTKRNFKTWVLAIARNTALDFMKKKRPVLFSKIEEGDKDLDTFLAPYVEAEESPELKLDRKDVGEALDHALQKLAPPYREVLALRYHEFMKFREIAEVLKTPIDTVKSRHRRGLLLLRKLVNEQPG